MVVVAGILMMRRNHPLNRFAHPPRRFRRPEAFVLFITLIALVALDVAMRRFSIPMFSSKPPLSLAASSRGGSFIFSSINFFVFSRRLRV